MEFFNHAPRELEMLHLAGAGMSEDRVEAYA